MSKPKKKHETSIRESIKGQFDQQADAILFRDLQEGLLEKNKFALPEDYLKRMIKTNNPEVTDENIDNEFDAFLKNLRWTIMRDKFAIAEDIKVSPEEIKNRFKAQMAQYMGGYGLDESMLDYSAQKLMENQEQVNKTMLEILTDKVFFAIKERINLEKKPVSKEEFEDIIKEIREGK